MRRMWPTIPALLLVLAACGAGGNPPGTNPNQIAPIAVSISPVTVNVVLNGLLQFTATLLGGGPQGPGTVVWSVAGFGTGTVDSTGLYHAPAGMPASPLVSVVATSVLDPGKSAHATVTLVTPPPVTAFPVKFDVVTQSGWQSALASVTVGIPMVRALHSDVNQLRIQTQANVGVPAQFKVTSRWNDNSIRWVLCDFIANLSGPGGIGKYQLNTGGTGSAAPGNLVVVNGGASIEVRTGQLTYVVSKNAFRLFESLLIDRDNDGQVDDQCLNTAAQRGVVITEGVNEFRTDQVTPTRVEVEESGPVRATIVVEGTHHNNALAQDKLNYIVRLTAWADLPLVKVSYSFKNMTGHGVAAATPSAAAAQLAQVTTADSVYLDIPLQLGSASVGALVGGNPNPHTGQVLSGAEYMDLMQGYTGTYDTVDLNNPQPPGYNAGTGDGSSVPLQNCWPDQTDALMAYDLTGKLVATGERSPGWAQLAGNQLRCTVVIRDFWQQYPKQLRIQADGLVRLGIWPAGTWPMQVFAGAMKTHEVLLSLDRLNVTDGPAAGVRAAILNDPPLCVFNPDYVAGTSVFGRIGVTNATLSDATDFIGPAQTLCQNYMAELVAHLGNLLFDRSDGNGAAAGHEYGMWNYGDGKTFSPEPGWENNDWEISRACLGWFAASGNIPLYRTFDSTARHFRDVNVLHSDIGLRFDYTEPGNPAVNGGKTSQLGKTRYVPNNKQHDLGNYHLGANHLDVFKGSFLAEHYLMTGDTLSLDVLREIYMYLRGSWKRFFDAGNGGIDSTLSCPTTWLSNAVFIATAYEVAAGSGDGSASLTRTFVLNALRARQIAAKPNDPMGNGFADSAGAFKAWQVGHVAEAMEYSRCNLADATLDDNILRCMNWLLGTNAQVYLGNPPTSQPGQFAESPGGMTDFGGPNLMIGAGYVGAFTQSADPAWRTRAQNLLFAQVPKILSATVGDDGMRHSTFAQFFRAGPLLLGALRQ